ncbi:ThiJ/PfpI domain protein [Segniliparus rotundus DSM 44985]|uniref:ThiJ/PfpI domain protein n=2 Tax=Segniliparus rotundus TaxID=286802 RepID=D6ZBZ8_SEGRD|nr:ThiJ/PfpI domain protein [Segniliparus rotundus DSM 44985]
MKTQRCYSCPMARRSVSILLFDGFELLDVFGPAELLSALPDDFALSFLGPSRAPVASAQGVSVNPDRTYEPAAASDILLLPGGAGTRPLVSDEKFLDILREHASRAGIVASVCTGSLVLAAAGLLDGYRATSNKSLFSFVSQHGQNVTWEPRARWVEDRDRWTSSGVAAGMDMTIALIRSLCGDAAAKTAADDSEIEPQLDPSHDPFADLYGL